jgi:SAM-dependent methyltransferase
MVAPALLPSTSSYQNASADMFEFFSRWVTLQGKSCLCIGFDGPQLQDFVLKYQPKSVSLLTLWAEHGDAVVSGFDVVIGDISQMTPFPAESFDVVLTLSLLEHIHDIEGAFLEIKRILKPQGYFGSFFGPSWSCHVGHHLYAEAGNPLLDFWQRGLPAHLHLLCSRDEVSEWYEQQGATAEQISTVMHWMFDAPVINRRFFDEYLSLFPSHFQMVGSEYMYTQINDEHLASLRKAHPGYVDFSSYGGKFLVRKYGVACGQ